MGRGGARKGAGRKPGAATQLNKAAREKVLASGTNPLDFMLAIMRGEDIPRADRFEAAKAAAPYVHARLAAVEHSGQNGAKNASEVTDDELANIAAGRQEAAKELLKRRLIRRSSIEWCRYCGFEPAAHHKPLIEKLEQVALGASDPPIRLGGYSRTLLLTTLPGSMMTLLPISTPRRMIAPAPI